MIRYIVLAVVAVASLALVTLVGVVPTSTPAAAGWRDNANSGYCPPGTTTPNGSTRARDVSHCTKHAMSR